MIPYLKTFFKEKQLSDVSWELINDAGKTHLIGNAVVIEHIGQTSVKEQNQIADVIRKIDSANDDVNDFLRHLAGALIND